MAWFLKHRGNLVKQHMLFLTPSRAGERGERTRLLSLVTRSQLKRILKRMLNESEFLSPFGIRSLSKEYAEKPYIFTTPSGFCSELKYEPAESVNGTYGGNSNW
jgi:hypothetical protein